MRSLLVNGYINENYLDYISHFHEVNITYGDYNFIRKVRSNKISNFDYKLEKVENTIQRINERHFEKIAILNNQIITFILKNKKQKKYKSRYNSLTNLLKSENKIVIQFIESYKANSKTENGLLFKELAEIWPNYWNYIISKTNKFSEKKINEYYQLFISNAALSDLKRIAFKTSFKSHFKKLSNLGELIEDKGLTEKFISIITVCNTKFDDISSLHLKNLDLYNHVVDNNFYKINKTNLLALAINESVSKEDFNTANYTTLRKLRNNSIVGYIEKEIETYVTNIFLALEENTKESDEALKLLLNNKDLSLSTRKLIVNYITTVFENLSDFEEINIKAELLNALSIATSWENVMYYYHSYESENLDSILINFLNKKDIYKQLNKKELPSNIEDETNKKFALVIIYCDDLSLKSHINLRACYSASWTGLSIEKLSFDKVESMIESKFISLSVQYFDKTKKSFSGLHTKLIEKGFSKYIKAHEKYILNEDDYLSILQSEVLNDAQKNQFLDTLDENEIIKNATIVSSATKIYVSERINNLSNELLIGLFKLGNSDEYKIKLFNLNVNNIDKAIAKTLISYLGYPYKNLIKPRKQEKVIINAQNIEFTNTLKRLGILTSNNEDKKNKGMLKLVASRYNSN